MVELEGSHGRIDNRMPRSIQLLLLGLSTLVTVLACSNGQGARLSSAELGAVMDASHAYESAWLSNDPRQVLATLTEDAVIIPSGMAAIKGHEAIRAFWWPADSPPTIVTEFTASEDDVGGHGDVAYVRGSFTLGFTYDGVDYSGGGAYLSILRQIPGGSWRISHRMWSDRPRTDE